MIFCVEILAIYEAPGVNPTGQRVNQRDTDFADAQTQAAAVGHAIAPQANEYMETFEAPSRYGFGWRGRQWVNVKQDADNIGNAVWTRLSTRGLRNGTKVEIFSRDETLSGYETGPITFRRRLPAGIDDIG